MSRLRAWAVVALLWVALLLNYIDRQAVFSIYPSLRHDVGFADQALGLIGSIFLWVYSLSSLLMGRVADVFRRESLIVLCLAFWSAAMIGTAASASPTQFLFWRGVMGLAEALYLPAAVAVIATLHTGESRSTAIALHQTAQMAGIVVGGWGGGWAADVVGWRPAFLWLGLAGIAYAVVLRFGLPSVPFVASAERGGGAAFLGIWRSRHLRALGLVFTAYCLMLWMIYAWLPALLSERFSLSQGDSGRAATLYLQASMAVGVVCWGYAADRLSSRLNFARLTVLCAGVFVSAPFAFAVTTLPNLTTVCVASAGFGFFAGALHANLGAAACDLVKPQQFGTAIGTLNLIGGAAGGGAVLLAGLLKSGIGIGPLMGGAAILSMVSSAFVLPRVLTRRQPGLR